MITSQFLVPVQGGSNIRLVEAVVERLLTSAVADMAVPVRRTVLESMKQMSDLDSYLAQADWYAQTVLQILPVLTIAMMLIKQSCCLKSP